MDIITTTIAGPLTRAEHGTGMCSGRIHGLSRVHNYADVWSEHKLPRFTAQPSPQRPRPDAISVLDPHAVSAPRRRSP